MIKAISIITLHYLFFNILNASTINTLNAQMNKFKINTALIVASKSIDNYPLWSNDNQYLFSNVMGKWYKIDLNDIELVKSRWRQNQELGVLSSNRSISLASPKEIRDAKLSTHFRTREYITKNNTKIELKQYELGTQFIITKNKKQNLIWTSKSENCHSLTSNSKEEYISFICEMNGVFVYQLK